MERKLQGYHAVQAAAEPESLFTEKWCLLLCLLLLPSDLLTFMEMRQPGWLFRSSVIVAQGVMFNLMFAAYLLSPKFCHSLVGYLEEEAVKTYTHAIRVGAGFRGLGLRAMQTSAAFETCSCSCAAPRRLSLPTHLCCRAPMCASRTSTLAASGPTKLRPPSPRPTGGCPLVPP